MSNRKHQIKRETSLDKIASDDGHLKSDESSVDDTTKHAGDVTLVTGLCDDHQRSVVQTDPQGSDLPEPKLIFVPVVDSNQKPLMPTTPARARKWILTKKATPFFKKGVFCVRLNMEPSDRKVQKVAVGIDPGSKREAFTVKSHAHTYLNVLTETPFWVSDSVKKRSNAAKGRGRRNTPCRPRRFNRSCRRHQDIVPSIKSRWQAKLRIVDWLSKMFPVGNFVVEDIKAVTRKGSRRWNSSFSPLEFGKTWFYSALGSRGIITTKQGYETYNLRNELGLKKISSKLDDKFECHNVDSWILANNLVGGHEIPDNTRIVKMVPLKFHRRQLHFFQPSKGGIRKAYGGTRSMGFSRGSWVKHSKYGLCYMGGTSENRVSLHDLFTGIRLCQNAKIKDVKFLTYSSWRMGVSA